jgi:hypothetical protein
MTLRNNILQIFKSRYTRALEEDIARLRNENRALINSILGISGLPPLRLDAEIARDNRLAEIEIKSRRSTAPAVSSAAAVTGRVAPAGQSGPLLWYLKSAPTTALLRRWRGRESCFLPIRIAAEAGSKSTGFWKWKNRDKLRTATIPTRCYSEPRS